MDMATHLEINDSKVSLLEGIDKSGIDRRWKEKTIADFIENLNDFYQMSKFHEFFVRNNFV